MVGLLRDFKRIKHAKNIYYAMVLSRINYCLIIYGSADNKVMLPLATGGGLAPGHAVTADGVRIVDLLCLPLKPSIHIGYLRF